MEIEEEINIRKNNRLKFRLHAIKRKLDIIIRNFSVKNLINNILKEPKRFINRLKNSQYPFSIILNCLLSSRLTIIFLVLILMIKTVLFYNCIELDLEQFGNINFISCIFIMILISPILFIKKNKSRFYAIITYDILLSLLLFADNLYWKYSVNMLSVSQIQYIKYTEEISGGLIYLLQLRQILYFIDIPILFGLWNIARKPLKDKKTSVVKNKGKRRVILAIIYTVCTVMMTSEIINLCYIEMQQNIYLKLRQVGLGSIYGYHYLDAYNAINIKDTVKYKNYDEMINEYAKLETYKKEKFKEEDIYGIANGKNIIVVQLESVQNFVVNREINGTEITPNLNKFLNENIHINNMIVQSYSTTADSEYSVITSLYPLDNGQAFSRYYASINNDIFKLYKDAGYHTSYMHGNVKEFWNRENVYKRLAVDEISFIDQFEDTSETINGYLSDELLYKQAVEKIEKYEKPFFSFIVAASSHTPYFLEGIERKEEKINVDVGESKDRPFGNYLEAINYADYAFGIFIDELKQKGLYENSVILVYGDHYGMGMDEWEVEEFIKEIAPNYNDITKRFNYVNLLCGIKIPEIESRKINQVVSKVDIKPTLLSLSGIEDNFSFGKTFFSTKDYAYINNGDIVTEKYYYYNNEWYDRQTGKVIDLNLLDEGTTKKLIEYENNMKLELDISRSIAISNLLNSTRGLQIE